MRSAVVVLIGLALAAAGCSSATLTSSPSPQAQQTATLVPATASAPVTPSAPPTPAPTDTPAPTPTAAPVETATPSLYLRIPSVGCCRGRELEPGRYEFPSWTDLALTVDVPEGWRVLNEASAELFMLGRGDNVQGNPIEVVLIVNATDGGTPEQILEAVVEAPQLSLVEAAAPAELAGFSGSQVDMQALPNPDFEGNPADDIPPGVQYLPAIQRYLAPGFVWITSSPSAMLRLISVDVGDQRLLVYLEAPPDEFDRLVSDATAMLGSLELIDP